MKAVIILLGCFLPWTLDAQSIDTVKAAVTNDIELRDSALTAEQQDYFRANGHYRYNPGEEIQTLVGGYTYERVTHYYVSPRNDSGFVLITTISRGDTLWRRECNRIGGATFRNSDWKGYVGGEPVQGLLPPQGILQGE